MKCWLHHTYTRIDGIFGNAYIGHAYHPLLWPYRLHKSLDDTFIKVDFPAPFSPINAWMYLQDLVSKYLCWPERHQSVCGYRAIQLRKHCLFVHTKSNSSAFKNGTHSMYLMGQKTLSMFFVTYFFYIVINVCIPNSSLHSLVRILRAKKKQLPLITGQTVFLCNLIVTRYLSDNVVMDFYGHR